jgi:hypothetical protein
MNYNIKLNDLLSDIESSNDNEYMFVKILNNNDDKTLFISKIPNKYYNEIFTTKKINLYLWLNIMELIQSNLSVNYIIYRKAYLGENKGKQTIKKQLTNYVIPLWSFHIERKKETFLKKIINNIMFIKTSSKHILLHDIMEQFEFNKSKYYLSSWENRDYEFKIRDFY